MQNVVVVNADTPLMRRFAGAFAAEWLQAGGSVPPAYRFEATPDALTSMRRELNRKPPGAALLALDSASATLAKPYLGTIPVYASGLVFERETVAVARDLDGLFLVEIPWIITPDAPQFANLPKREFPSAALTRLYALGLDAFRVAQAFRDGAPERFSLDGATGQVTLGEGRQFVREGRLGVFRDGSAGTARCPALNVRLRGARATAGARAEALAAEYPGTAGPRRCSSAISAPDAARSISSMRDGDTLVFVEVRLRTNAALRRRGRQHHAAQARAPASPRRRSTSRGSAASRPCRFDAVLLDALDPRRGSRGSATSVERLTAPC